MSYHCTVAANPVLLIFLTSSQVRAGKSFTLPGGATTEEFVTWLSPYYRWAFARAMTQAIRDTDKRKFKTILSLPRAVTKTDEWGMWDQTAEYLDAKVEELAEMNYMDWPPLEITDYADEDLMDMVFSLPPERFSDLHSNYIYELSSLATNKFKGGDHNYALALMRRLKRQPMTDENKETVTELEMNMKANLKSRGWDATGFWMTVFLYAFYCTPFILLYLSSC